MYSATYGYRYGSKLYSVASSFPGEGSVTYNYGGDQKRRQRTVGGVSRWYNWNLGWSVINEESGTGSGTLQKTYVGGAAEIAGSTPATGAYSYYATDNLGSPRAVYNQAKALVAELDYTPYGQAYTANDTVGITHRYTGHDWDATAALYFAPYRFYNPQIARWMSRDPLGRVDGPNVIAYVAGDPVQRLDRLGLFLSPLGMMCGAMPPTKGDSGSCCIYDSGDTYMGYNAKCVCENAGDSPWDMTVRSCLACMHLAGVNPGRAHRECYIMATLIHRRIIRDVLDIFINLTGECAIIANLPEGT